MPVRRMPLGERGVSRPFGEAAGLAGPAEAASERRGAQKRAYWYRRSEREKSAASLKP